MIAFYIALTVGSVVAVTYITLVLSAFFRVRRSLASAQPDLADADTSNGAGAQRGHTAADGDTPDVYQQQGRNFAWKAGGGVVVSTGLLAAISLTPSAWYILPFLGIGSSLAVITAFLVDRRRERTGEVI